MAELRVRSTLDGSGFHGPLNRMRGAVSSFSQGVAGQLAAVFSVGAITQFSRATVELASKLSHMADSLEVNVEWLQKMLLAVRQAGGKDKDLEKFILNINKARAYAQISPNSQYARAFQGLGFSQDELGSMSKGDIARKIIDQFKSGFNDTLLSNVQFVGGGAANNLIVAFKNGIDEGASVMTEATIDALEDFDSQLEQVKTTLMNDLAPALVDTGNAILQLIYKLTEGRNVIAEFMGSAYVAGSQAYAQGISDQDERIRKFIAQRKRQGWSKERINAELGKFGLSESDSESVWKDMERAAISGELEYQSMVDSRNERLKQKRDARRRGGVGEPPASSAGIISKSSPATDSLLSVGNFLGSGRNAIDAVGKETNRLLKIQNQLLQTIASNTARSGETIIVPGI